MHPVRSSNSARLSAQSQQPEASIPLVTRGLHVNDLQKGHHPTPVHVRANLVQQALVVPVFQLPVTQMLREPPLQVLPICPSPNSNGQTQFLSRNATRKKDPKPRATPYSR